MKLLRAFSFCAFFIFQSCFTTNSISSMGNGDMYLYSKRIFPPAAIEKFKESKTIFYYGRETGKSLDSLKEAVTSAWDLTPIIFEHIDKYFDYAGEAGYSCFVIEGGKTGYSSTNTKGQSTSVASTHLYLALRPYNELGFCRIELYPDSKTLLSDDYDQFKYSTAYKKGYFFNWTPVYLKAHLEIVAENLKTKNLRPHLFEKYKSPDLAKLLANDTLYVSGELLGKFNPLSGKEKDIEKGPFKNYKFPYRVCSGSELYNIFITQKRGRFLFEYVKSSAFKFIKIFDMKNKELVYEMNEKGYNLNPEDLAAIH